MVTTLLASEILLSVDIMHLPLLRNGEGHCRHSTVWMKYANGAGQGKGADQVYQDFLIFLSPVINHGA